MTVEAAQLYECVLTAWGNADSNFLADRPQIIGTLEGLAQICKAQGNLTKAQQLETEARVLRKRFPYYFPC